MEQYTDISTEQLPNTSINIGYMMADILRQDVQLHFGSFFLEVVRECSNLSEHRMGVFVISYF